MTHAQSEQLVSHYYEHDRIVGQHLEECSACRGEFTRLAACLNEVRDTSVPEPNAEFESRLWARVRTALPQHRSPHWPRAAAAFAALAAVLLLVVYARRPQTPVPVKSNVQSSAGARDAAGRRVLDAELNQHLEQTQILLTELEHRPVAQGVIGSDRAQARELIDQGRLLRAALRQRGEERRAAVLEELEPTLLTVANGPESMKPGDWEGLQSRLRDNGLLFKVAVTRSNLRNRSPL